MLAKPSDKLLLALEVVISHWPRETPSRGLLSYQGGRVIARGGRDKGLADRDGLIPRTP